MTLVKTNGTNIAVLQRQHETGIRDERLKGMQLVIRTDGLRSYENSFVSTVYRACITHFNFQGVLYVWEAAESRLIRSAGQLMGDRMIQ